MHSGFAVAFHESIGGIRPDPDHPGFKRFLLKPCFLPGLEWAKADYESTCGKISSHWKRVGGEIVWEVAVPEPEVDAYIAAEAARRNLPPSEHKANLAAENQLDRIRHAARVAATVDEMIRRAGGEVE